MDDRHDRLRHRRVAQHASVRREKSQVSEVIVSSSHAEASTYGAHVFPYAYPSSSSRRRGFHLQTHFFFHPHACDMFHIFRY